MNPADEEARGDWLDFKRDFDWETIRPSRREAEEDRREAPGWGRCGG